MWLLTLILCLYEISFYGEVVSAKVVSAEVVSAEVVSA